MQAENPRRRLPPVQKLLETPEAGVLCGEFGRGAVTGELRRVLDGIRRAIAAREVFEAPEIGVILQDCRALLERNRRLGLRRVVNATGVVLHTNLGRAPMAAEAIAAVADVAAGYANLEFDLVSGARGSRTGPLEVLLCEMTGAEAALAVNNGAAAVLLALSALADGGEVIVSRGELVEIGGGFRIPEVIAQGGARLVEIGSTNKTRIADYRKAIGPDSRVLLKVHQSNFKLIGFVAEARLEELAALARERGLLTVADLGSGLLRDVPGTSEPTVAEALAAGANLVTFSGDKLLGGPQAGLILGSKAAIDPLRKHPLLRALRLDKMSLAALEATLILHRDCPERVPVNRMLGQGEAELQSRAERLRAMLGFGEVVATQAFAGGGSLPEERIASRALALAGATDRLAARLRQGEPAVVGRIADGRLLIDMLTISDEELPLLAQALKQACE